jgi:hypothetical protein
MADTLPTTAADAEMASVAQPRHQLGAEPALHRVIYVSSSRIPFSDQDLVELLTIAQRNNHRVGISGMLLYNDGNWLQVLEGSREAVRSMFMRIRVDNRHQDVIQVLDEPIDSRLFDQWSMGFRNLSGADLSSLPGFTDFMNKGSNPRAFRPDASGCLEILRMFRDG